MRLMTTKGASVSGVGLGPQQVLVALTAPSKAGASAGISAVTSPETILSPDESNCIGDAPASKIPPMFLYTLRTGGTGTVGKSSGAGGEISSGPREPMVAGLGSLTKAIVREDLSSSSFDGFSSNFTANESTLQKQQRDMFETRMNATTRAAETPVSPFAAWMGLNDAGTGKNVDNSASKRKVVDNAAEKRFALHDSADVHSRSEGEVSGSTGEIPSQGKEDSRKKSPLALRSPRINFSSASSFPAKRSEESLRAPKGKERSKSFVTPSSPAISSSMGTSPAKRAKDTLKRASSYNSTLRHGNAVIYNAGSLR